MGHMNVPLHFEHPTGTGNGPLPTKAPDHSPFPEGEPGPMNDDTLKQAGLKITRPRSLILKILETADQRHLSAEDVYRLLLAQGEEVSIATIYRVLSQFELAGIVERHYFDAGTAVFEAPPNGHHDHMVCVRCGRVVEFVDPLIEERQKEIAKQRGFEIDDHSMVIYVLCDNPGCREK